MSRLSRLRAMLAGLWAGALLCIGLIAAPTAFAVLERAQAGQVVARLFAQEANLSLAMALLLMLIERRLARDSGAGPISLGLLAPAGALFCTVAGYHALQPLMEAARAGQGSWSFLTLHAVSLGFFGAKILLVLTLAWRSGKHG